MENTKGFKLWLILLFLIESFGEDKLDSNSDASHLSSEHAASLISNTDLQHRGTPSITDTQRALADEVLTSLNSHKISGSQRGEVPGHAAYDDAAASTEDSEIFGAAGNQNTALWSKLLKQNSKRKGKSRGYFGALIGNENVGFSSELRDVEYIHRVHKVQSSTAEPSIPADWTGGKYVIKKPSATTAATTKPSIVMKGRGLYVAASPTEYTTDDDEDSEENDMETTTKPPISIQGRGLFGGMNPFKNKEQEVTEDLANDAEEDEAVTSTDTTTKAMQGRSFFEIFSGKDDKVADDSTTVSQQEGSVTTAETVTEKAMQGRSFFDVIPGLSSLTGKNDDDSTTVSQKDESTKAMQGRSFFDVVPGFSSLAEKNDEVADDSTTVSQEDKSVTNAETVTKKAMQGTSFFNVFSGSSSSDGKASKGADDSTNVSEEKEPVADGNSAMKTMQARTLPGAFAKRSPISVKTDDVEERSINFSQQDKAVADANTVFMAVADHKPPKSNHTYDNIQGGKMQTPHAHKTINTEEKMKHSKRLFSSRLSELVVNFMTAHESNHCPVVDEIIHILTQRHFKSKKAKAPGKQEDIDNVVSSIKNELSRCKPSSVEEIALFLEQVSDLINETQV